MIRVIIISGFLGSGKTTLIKKILSNKSNLGKVMLLENEFGEVGIDGQLLKNNLEVKEINNGCICCSLEGTLEDALDEIATYDIDTLIVEPTGVAKLSELKKSFCKNSSFELTSTIAMVDVTKAEKYHKNFPDFYDNQIENSLNIVLSRTDIADKQTIKNAMHLCEDLNENAIIVSTPIDKLSDSFIYELLVEQNDSEEECECCCQIHKHHHHDEEGCCCEHHHEHEHHDECCCGEHHHHHHDDPFNSIGFKTIKKYSETELKEILSKLSDTIIRAKGIVESDDAWLHFEYTPGEYYIEKGEANYTGLISIIGTDINKKELEELFKIND